MKLQATCLLNGAPPMLHDSPRNSVTRSSRDLDDAPSAAVMESPNAATTWQGPHKLPKIGQTREARWIKRKALRAPTQGCLTVMSPGLSLWMLVGAVGDGRPLHVNAVEGAYLTDEKLLPMLVRVSTVTGIADASCMKAQTAAAKHRVAMLSWELDFRVRRCSSKQDSNSENVPLILVSVCGDSEFEASRATRVLLRPDVSEGAVAWSPLRPRTIRSGRARGSLLVTEIAAVL